MMSARAQSSDVTDIININNASIFRAYCMTKEYLVILCSTFMGFIPWFFFSYSLYVRGNTGMALFLSIIFIAFCCVVLIHIFFDIKKRRNPTPGATAEVDEKNVLNHKEIDMPPAYDIITLLPPPYEALASFYFYPNDVCIRKSSNASERLELHQEEDLCEVTSQP